MVRNSQKRCPCPYVWVCARLFSSSPLTSLHKRSFGKKKAHTQTSFVRLPRRRRAQRTLGRQIKSERERKKINDNLHIIFDLWCVRMFQVSIFAPMHAFRTHTHARQQDSQRQISRLRSEALLWAAQKCVYAVFPHWIRSFFFQHSLRIHTCVNFWTFSGGTAAFDEVSDNVITSVAAVVAAADEFDDAGWSTVISVASTNSADSYELLSLLFIAAATVGVNCDVVNFATAVAINVADAGSLMTIFWTISLLCLSLVDSMALSLNWIKSTGIWDGDDDIFKKNLKFSSILLWCVSSVNSDEDVALVGLPKHPHTDNTEFVRLLLSVFFFFLSIDVVSHWWRRIYAVDFSIVAYLTQMKFS